MNKTVLAIWLALPVVAAGYHFTASERLQQLDAVGDHLNAARSFAVQKSDSKSLKELEAALKLLPDDATELRRDLSLEIAQAKLNSSRLPEAYEELKKLLDSELEAGKDKSANDEFVLKVRESLANAQYHLTWLMRLEGAPKEEWEPEVESARQNYRLLAESAKASGDDAELKSQLENLEATIRLERMALTDLQGQPLPKQCSGCCSGQCRSRRQGPPKNGKNEAKDARGATAGPPADGEGT